MAEKPTGKPREKPAEAKPKRQRVNRELTTAEWRRIRIAYIKGNTTYRALAEKWQLTESYIRKRASKEGWGKKKRKLDEKVEQKVLERACDARAREFELIAQVNDRMDDVLANLVKFIGDQPPKKYDDLRGVESLTKAIAQVVETKRDLYNVPNEIERAKMEALREKARLDRERFTQEQAEKAASKTAESGTVFRVVIESEEGEADLDG